MHCRVARQHQLAACAAMRAPEPEGTGAVWQGRKSVATVALAVGHRLRRRATGRALGLAGAAIALAPIVAATAMVASSAAASTI